MRIGHLPGVELEFSLFAPYVAHVELIGSWSGDPIALSRDEKGRWSVDADLPDGTHTYRFRLPSRSPFLHGKVVDVTDPQSRLVDEFHGDGSLIVVRDGSDVTVAPEFEWKHDGVPLPQNQDLTIYELHVGEFGWSDDRPGRFRNVVERLDYLRDLGINAIELMPVGAFPGDQSWGYNVRHPFAVETVYGEPADLKYLVDECHGRGIRVIMDLVLNHVEFLSPLTQIDFYYWFRDARDGELSFGPKFDYEMLDEEFDVMPARKYAHEIARFWISEYHLDGYRLDATAILDNFDLVREVREIANDVSGGKPIFIVAEQLPEDPAIAGTDAPADGAWHQWFEHAVIGAMTNLTAESESELLLALQPSNHGYESPGLVVNYVESHDEQTLMHVLAQDGTFGPSALRKHKLVSTLLFTAVGIPMLYQGQEFGGNRVRDMEIRPLQWDLLEHEFGQELYAHHRSISRIRHESPALKGVEFEALDAGTIDGLIVFRRGGGDAEVIVIANLVDEEREISVSFPDGAWREITFDYDVVVQDGVLSETILASGAKLFVRKS